MTSIIQGLILGFVIVFPGMSGGTLFLLFGIYDKLIDDLSKFKLKPYLPLVGGTIAGIFLGGVAFTLLFSNFRDIISAFLLGCILASIKTVMEEKPKVTPSRLVVLVAGFIIGFILTEEPMGLIAESVEVSWFLLIVGGAVSTATMLIPGLPGSSVLIILGIYDNILFSLRELALFNLSFFTIGSLLGILLLARIFNVIYSRHRALIAYIFSGLIVGSAKVVLPFYWTVPVILAFLGGFSLVWWWGEFKNKGDSSPADLKRSEPSY